MKRLIAIFGCLCALVGGIIAPAPAYAGTAEHLGVMLTSHKDSYAQGDVATFEVAITNSSSHTAEEVSYSVSLPEGMEVTEDSLASGDVGMLAPGESFVASVKANVVAQDTAAENIPATGDVVPAAFVMLLVLGVTLAVGSRVVRRKSGIGTFALILAFVMAGSALLPLSEASATGQRSKTSSFCQFELNDEPQTATLTVAYALSSGGQAADPGEPDTMTRAEWVVRLLEGTGATYVEDADVPYGDIAGHQYETAIKTAYALGIVPDDGASFRPDETATRDFVYSTAVLAAGFSDDGATLEAADADEADHPALLAIAVDIEFVQIDENGNIRPLEPFVAAEADRLIELIVQVSNTTIDGDGDHEYVLQDDVIEIDEYQFDESSSSFTFEAAKFDVTAGSKVALLATEANPYGAAGTVTNVTSNGDGTITATFEQATDPSQIFVSLRASQTGVEIDSSMVVAPEQTRAASRNQRIFDLDEEGEWEPEGGELGDSFSVDLDDAGSYVSGSFSMRPTLGYDIEWSLFGGLERCNLDFDGAVNISAQAHVQNSGAGKDIEVLRATVPLGWGFSVDVPIYLHVTMEGDLVATVDYTMNTSVRLVNDHWQMKDDSDFNTELSAALHLRLGGKVGAEFEWLRIQIVDAAVEAGVEGAAKTTVRETGMTCGDLSGHAYAGVEVGLKTDYLVWLGWTVDKDIITASNSPFKFAWHWEDGVRVPECTYGQDSSDDSGDSDEGGTGVVDPNFDGIPEQEDEGWGNEPIWTVSEDGTKAVLDEPFYIEAGTSLTIRAGEDCRWRAMFGAGGNTLVRRVYSSDDPEPIVDLAQGVYMQPWDMGDYGSYTVEVLSGRLKVWDLEGWCPATGTEEQRPVQPMLTFGSCETVEYPVTLSATSVTMRVGSTYQLSAEQTVQDVYADTGCEYDYGTYFEWSSEDASVAMVDDNGLITATGVGTTYVQVSYGWEPNGFSRLYDGRWILMP